MNVPDQELKRSRMVFYTEDVDRLESELDSFLECSRAKSAFLIDREGHQVTRRGETVTDALESLAALIAGSFAATKEMARLLGEEEFNTLSHQGQHHSIQLLLVGPRTLLAIVWDERTNLGLVRFYAQETARRLAEVFVDIANRPVGMGMGEGLSDEYSKEAAAALDDLF